MKRVPVNGVARSWRFRLAAVVLSAGLAALGACESTTEPPARDAGGAGDAGDAGDAGADATVVAEGGLAESGPPAPDAGTLHIARAGGTPISPYAFGHNYWDWADWAGDGVTGVTGTEARVKALGLDVLRAGGFNNDFNGPPPAVFDHAQLDAFVAYCRSVGAEPILQVPVLADVDGGSTSAQTAADMVTYANVTKGYGIRFWEIGNEPDLYARSFDAGIPLTPGDFCSVYHAYATAMKAANAAAGAGAVTMTFLGPELSYQYFPGIDFLTPFLDACKDDVDIVSIHRYPFAGSATSIMGALTDVTQFKSVVASVSAIVAGHARPNTPLAITEANISYDYQSSAYTTSSLEAAPTTFYAGLWTADILGAALQQNLWTMAFWDIGDPSSAPSVLGYLQDGQPVPSYYAMQMISTTFRGNTVVPTGAPTGYSAYASYDATAGSTSVLVLNKTTAPGRLAIAIDMLPIQAFDFPALSASVVQIPDDPAAAPSLLRYTQDQADAGMGPIAVP